MPAGLQVFDASGAIKLTLTDRLTRIYQTYNFPMPTNTNWIYTAVSGMESDGTWYAVYPDGSYEVVIESGQFAFRRRSTGFTATKNVPVTIYRF